MKFVLLLALFAVGCFSAPESRTIINDQIRGMIDGVRTQMAEGWPDSDPPIPSLAPLLIEHLDLNVDSDSLQAIGFVSNVRVDGLNKFIDDIIQFSLVGLRLTFRIVVPEVYLTGLYDLNGRILNRFPVRGSGPFRGIARDIVVSGHCRLALSGGFLYMREFVPVITIGSIVSEFDGLISNEALTSDFINRLLEVLLLELIHLHDETISQTVAGIVIPIADSRLNNMTIADLLPFADVAAAPQITLY